jgi:SPP1 gp7 family putative phage head morphogenesis protein
LESVTKHSTISLSSITERQKWKANPMKLIPLKPIRSHPEEFDVLEERIKDLFRTEIYLPLIAILGVKKSKIIKNANNTLTSAIRSGQIYYWRGSFYGKFDAEVSSQLLELGAQWNKTNSSFDLRWKDVPVEFRPVIAQAEQKFSDRLEQLDKRLLKLDPNEITERLKSEPIFKSTLYRIDKEFKQSIKGLTVAPELSPEGYVRLAKEYTENINLKIKGWMRDEVLELREKIQKQALKGVRYEGIIKTIQSSYGVSQRKAKFLARQETHLILAKFKEIRYSEAGVKAYKWRCVTGSPNHPVRPRHKELNDESNQGKIFYFDDPPRVTEKGEPMRYGNPGEDFNCRCVSIPVLKIPTKSNRD